VKTILKGTLPGEGNGLYLQSKTKEQRRGGLDSGNITVIGGGGSSNLKEKGKKGPNLAVKVTKRGKGLFLN